MRIEDLETALDRYGGDLGRWPAALRAEADALIAANAKAARMAAMAARLDGILADIITPVPVDAAFAGRIVATVNSGGHPQHDVALRPTPRLAAWAGAAVAVFLAAGYVGGLLLPASVGEDALAGLMFGNSTTAELSDTGSTL